jgi:tetratricopeptide (TPR) repeat protein
MAACCSYVGNFDDCNKWQAESRACASRIGDETIHAALIANIAALRINHLRLKELSLGVRLEELSEVGRLADSYRNFSALTGMDDFIWSSASMDAELLARERNYRRALSLYEVALTEDGRLNRQEARIYADMAWCWLNLGEGEQALELARRSAASFQLLYHLDDCAVTARQLAHIFDSLGSKHESAAFLAQAQKTSSDLESERAWLSLRLMEVPRPWG